MWTKTDDGSIIDQQGKVIFFSTERFVNDICLGACCFICGARRGEKTFNDEHILPRWLLKKYDLFQKTITLPNETTVRYGTYTVSCCQDCNSLMGNEIETPISEVVQRGPDAVNDFIASGHLLKVIIWMGLIFLKTHLKDRFLRLNLDKRLGTERIADGYEWEKLHHVHSVVRCFFTGCFVEREAVGSFLSLPVRTEVSADQFDFADLYYEQTMLLRMGDLALLTVFDDSGGVLSYFYKRLERITGPVSELQLREIMAEFAFLNLHLRERPVFYTECDRTRQTCRVVGRRPQLDLSELDMTVRGRLLRHTLRHALNIVRVPGLSESEVLEEISSGRFTLLFDDEGNFITQSVQPI